MPETRIPDDFLASIADLKGSVTVVVNDATRPSPASYLSALKNVLAGRARFLFATGTHRPVSDEESRAILGGFFHEKCVSVSNLCDSGEHVFIGSTPLGTEVEVHPWLLEGPVLAVNTVEPHYFAGYTGGRKSFLPGLTSRKTTVQNHFLACKPEALAGKLKGNPVHEDMMQGAALLADRTMLLMVNGVSGGDEVFCGSYDSSFYRAVEVAAGRCAVPLEKRYSSLEVRPGKSLEVSLYQSMKAVFLWERAVNDGGELVLSSACREGLGAEQMERLLEDSAGFPPVPHSAADYRLGDHAAVRLGQIRKRLRLSFRVGIDMERFGFSQPPSSCAETIEDAGFFFPEVTAWDE